ncbi:hypothetical protein [Catellatospora tritici]|uniref:hypothetical protein n=1 Tax=Catellatospora tritici TaxID=2851566 RepID=UPI001C2DA171|nr:hypothetical protein [Catellatospora tritici]MBV1854474.1 hypothetical protein [Catellatospora tritici]
MSVPPTGAGAAPTPAKAAPRGGRGLAAISLVVSLIAAALSVVAVLRSGPSEPEATANPGGAPSAQAKPGNDAPQGQPTNEAAPQPSPSASVLDVLNPQATFTSAYTQQQLIPQVTRNDRAYLDLNEPRVVNGNSDRFDVYLTLPYSSSVPVIQLDEGVEAAVLMNNENPQPEDCTSAIRTSPVPPSATTAAQRPLVMCIATSPKQAASVGQAQVIVVLKVTALSDDAKVTMQLTAWKLPS